MALHLPFTMDPSTLLIIGGSAASVVAVGSYSLFRTKGKRQAVRALDSKSSIQDFVKHQLRIGYNLSQIKQNLINSGHTEKIVREVVSNLELYKYVYHNMKDGHHATKVKKALLQWCWTEQHVNHAIVHASHRILRQNHEQRSVIVRPQSF